MRLPTTIGLMVMALGLSLLMIVAGILHPPLVKYAEALVKGIDFNSILMHGMLGFLLFAGALHVELSDLVKQRRIVALTATLGVVGSTFLVGGFVWCVLRILGLQIEWIHCLLFGALISPTDPISVLGIMKKVGAPRSLATKMSGESLFNDGVGVVVFLGILNVAEGSHEFTMRHVGMLFLQEACGGALLGLILGLVAYYLLKTVEDYEAEILITLSVVAGGYPLALALHISGPIAMVVAGLIVGNHGRRFAMGDEVRDHVDTFWQLVDEILNAVLFVLIGLEVLILTWQRQFLLAGLLMIPAVLLARFLTVGGTVAVLLRFRTFSPKAVRILTWGGLRGGISVALALSIPPTLMVVAPSGSFPVRDLIVTMTYIVVVFSIVVQGLTIGPYIQRSLKQESEP